MLPTLKTAVADFASASVALDHLACRVQQRFTFPIRDLRVDAAGRAFHVGTGRIDGMQGLPMTDVALAHVDRFAGIPPNFGEHIDGALHEHSLHDLLSKHLGVVTVVVEHDRDEPDARQIVAVVSGARATVSHETVLRRLVALGVESTVRLHGGSMNLRFGSADHVELFPGDSVELRGALRNDGWGDGSRPLLDVSMFVLRLVCENGAFAQRELASARTLAWSSEQDLSRFVERQIGRVLDYPRSRLREAAQRMADTVPDDREQARVRALIERHAGSEDADALTASATSVFEWWNAITAAGAHHARTEAGRQRLQIAGGAMLDEYLSKTRAA